MLYALDFASRESSKVFVDQHTKQLAAHMFDFRFVEHLEIADK